MEKKYKYKSIKCDKCGKQFNGRGRAKYCKECVKIVRNERTSKYYYENHEKNKRRNSEYMKKRNAKIKLEVIRRYGGNPPKCACCGEKEYDFLSIDHIDNNGAEHRRILGVKRHSIYDWLYKAKFSPEEYQVLCMNCNCAKSWYGKCPHQRSNK